MKNILQLYKFKLTEISDDPKVAHVPYKDEIWSWHETDVNDPANKPMYDRAEAFLATLTPLEREMRRIK